MKGFRVTANTAGTESTANSRSVVSTINRTSASGVRALRPSQTVMNFCPSRCGRDGIELPRPLDHAILLRVNLGFDEEHLDAAVEEEGAEEIEDPIHQGDERNANADHQAAHDQRAENAPVQDAMLVFAGDAEIGKDEGDDKDVVHREGQLDQIAGDELEGLLLSAQGFQGQGKEHRQGEPDRCSRRALP